ncbi:hypothetical protein ACIHAX_29095, partial [Nocardia sp. NPDC051929]|uniref:hypothetical protein n=1 Tax=unclassified Nocardia TaxID=2637762 RepID=UPI00342C47D8
MKANPWHLPCAGNPDEAVPAALPARILCSIRLFHRSTYARPEKTVNPVSPVSSIENEPDTNPFL